MGKFKIGDRVTSGGFAYDWAEIVGTTNDGEPYALRYDDGSEGDFIWFDYELILINDEKTAVPDAISPKHYSEGMPEGVQVIDIIRAQKADFLHGNALKYLLRWKFKNGVEDLKKAQVYLQWLVEQEEAKNV